MDVKKFREDLLQLADRTCQVVGEEARPKMLSVVSALVERYRKNAVKINHSALEVVCAGWMIAEGYDVKVEHRMGKGLVSDLVGMSGHGGQLIVEIETGFIPPEAALAPSLYTACRIAGKVARYGGFSGRFALGTTPTYILDYPSFFLVPRAQRSVDEARMLKERADRYYSRPPISVDEFMRAKIDSVVVIDVDTCRTKQVDPTAYLRSSSLLLSRSDSPNAYNERSNRDKSGSLSQNGTETGRQ